MHTPTNDLKASCPNSRKLGQVTLSFQLLLIDRCAHRREREVIRVALRANVQTKRLTKEGRELALDCGSFILQSNIRFCIGESGGENQKRHSPPN